MKPIFFYGTLRDRVLLGLVVGRKLAPEEASEARAPGYRAWRVAGQAYPMLRSVEDGVAEGLLFRPAGPEDIAALIFYEEEEYALQPLSVETAAGQEAAETFAATERLAPGGEPWDFERWWREDRAVAMEAARELMPHRATLDMRAINTVWPGIMNRARQRARAAASTPVLGSVRTGFRLEEDVRWVSHENAYTSYLSVEEHRLEHRRFDGGWCGPIGRTTVAWGDAVTVLPYDPVRDRVLMIEQFRAAAAARHDPNPWCIEVPAGRIDADEDDETALRREAEEEAGVTLGRIERLPGYYPTPGLASEHLGAYLAEADLPDGTGGHFGVAHEHEDIRAFVLGFEEAMAALRAGAVNTGPAQILLLWLAVERARLRRDWAGPRPA
ncbi:MAG: NUDIX domain-containing protein [Pseudomonadota bacterium]